eukprot:jgi/Psemu1/227578/e_gw1.2082.10.1
MVYRPASGRDFYDDQYEDEEEGLNNRIVFPEDRVYGRAKELQILNDIFDQLYENNDDEEDKDESQPQSQLQRSPVVFIQASAGSGKSSLVRSFINQLEKKAKSKRHTTSSKYTAICSIRGRFGRTSKDPFSAFLDALDAFFERLLQNKDYQNTTNNLERIRRAIDESLKSETLLLTALIPRLGDVLKSKNDGNATDSFVEEVPSRSMVVSNSVQSDADNASMTDPNAWNRIRYLFHALFRAICSEQYPLIMFLDDCQWADDESLGLIESLIQDPACRYFMFIGNATRGIAQAKEQKPNFVKLMKNIEGIGRKVTRINLLNLSIEEVGEFIGDTLKLGVDECRPLTEVIYGKTRGNIFFTMQALEELQRRNILYFSMIMFRWEWNLDGVEFQDALSDDVAEYVSSKIQSLPSKLRRALVIASHTKETFDVRTLQALMNEDGIDVDLKELNGLLDLAVLVGLLMNTIGTDVFLFANDRVQQAAYWMVPGGEERSKLRTMIGRKLYELYFQSDGKEWMLFVAADHLNSCIGHGGKDDLSLAKLNLSCGKKARFLGAYVPASMYLRLALSYLRKLDNNPWKSHYDLSLEVYRELSNSELCLGNFENGNELAQIVLTRTTNLEDKLPTFVSLATAKGKRQNHAESLALCQEALVRVGAIPKRMHWFRMKRDVIVIRRLLQKLGDDDILLLPICRDKKNEMVMDLLSQASQRAHICGLNTELRFCIARKLRLTFKFGFTRGSAHAFASYGQFLLDSGNDVKSALRMARLAREILAKTDQTSSMKSLTLYVVGYWIEAWSFHREHVIQTLQEAHLAGMARGNIAIGFQCIVFCNIFAQSAGYPLEPIEEAGAQLIEQLRLYNVDNVLTYLMACRVSVLCLMGRKNIDWEELEPNGEAGTTDSDLYNRIFSLMSRLELGVLFGNTAFAVRMAEKIASLHEFGRSYTTGSKENFYAALAYLDLARKTGLTKYKTKAFEYVKTLRYFCRTRGQNVLHKCLLMEAEVLSLECLDSHKLGDAYDEGILAAVEMGYIQDAALGSELAGASMIIIGETDRANQYLGQACSLWLAYGASAKVRHISKKHDLTVNEEFSISYRTNVITSRDMRQKSALIDLQLLVGTTIKRKIQIDASVKTLDDSCREEINGKSQGKLSGVKSASDFSIAS